MARTIDIAIIDKKSGTKDNLSISIADDEWSTLLEFKKYIDQLNESDAMKGGLKVNYGFKYKAGESLRLESTQPSDDVVAVLLHRLRPVILQKEKTYFHKVCNILSKNINHSKFHEITKGLRELFSGINFQKQIVIKTNNVTMNSDEVLMKWLNAHEYHRDEDKKKFIEELHRRLPFENTKAIYLSMIIDKINSTLYLSHIIGSLESGDGAIYL